MTKVSVNIDMWFDKGDDEERGEYYITAYAVFTNIVPEYNGFEGILSQMDKYVCDDFITENQGEVDRFVKQWQDYAAKYDLPFSWNAEYVKCENGVFSTTWNKENNEQ